MGHPIMVIPESITGLPIMATPDIITGLPIMAMADITIGLEVITIDHGISRRDNLKDLRALVSISSSITGTHPACRRGSGLHIGYRG